MDSRAFLWFLQKLTERKFMQVLLNKLLDWLMILMLLVVTLVVPTYIESLF